MTREEFLLLKLAEECAEVAQRALKQIQFGADQVQKAGEVEGGQGPAPKEAGLSNKQRLTNEVMDFAVIVGLLYDSGQLGEYSPSVEEATEAKVAKLNKYVAFARTKGLLLGDWTI